MKDEIYPDDQVQIRNLIQTRLRNNQYSWALCDYLNEMPASIDEELMMNAGAGTLLSDEMAYDALLGVFCGFDPERKQEDKIIMHDYVRPSVHELSSEPYQQDDYYVHIQIPEVEMGRWQLGYDHYQPYEAFVCDDIHLEPDYREIPQIGFFKEAFDFPVVKEMGHEWMAVKPNEIETMRPHLEQIQGSVVTFGLGLGYFAYMASQKKCVTEITVVERDEEVIALFKKYILPQFSHPEKVHILQMDAFEYVRQQMPMLRFDYAFVDLWHDVSDGLPLYLRMKSFEKLVPQTHFLYWVEESLLSAYRWQQFDEVIAQAASFEEIQKQLSDEYLKEQLANN